MKFVLLPGALDRSTVEAECIQHIRDLPPTRGFTIEVKRFVKTKTNKQTAALFGLAYPMLRAQTGHDVDDLHEYFLGEFFGWREENFFGKKKLRPARTLTTGFDGEPDELSAAVCAELFDFVQVRAAQAGIEIPDPDPHWRQNRSAA